METRAPYALVGLFVLAVVAAAFGFVYWLHNTGGLGERTVYRIQFENTVAGLLKGAAVLFNGIRVGEVTALELNPANPNQVDVTIAVAADTPVRADTKISLDFQGLTGAPVVILQGGTVPIAQRAAASGPPRLVADPHAGQSMTSAARDALRRVDTILSENAEPLRNTISNLNTFTGALARNSDKLDNIVAGLDRLAGGGPASAARVVYDLAAPRLELPGAKVPDTQLAIVEPTALIMFEGRKIMMRPGETDDPSFANAEWSDSIPKMVHAKVIQSFENAGLAKVIARPTDGVSADNQLVLDIRSFQFSRADTPRAEIEVAARLVSSGGRIVEAKVFRASYSAKGLTPSEAVAAFDSAFAKIMGDLMPWVIEAL